MKKEEQPVIDQEKELITETFEKIRTYLNEFFLHMNLTGDYVELTHSTQMHKRAELTFHEQSLLYELDQQHKRIAVLKKAGEEKEALDEITVADGQVCSKGGTFAAGNIPDFIKGHFEQVFKA